VRMCEVARRLPAWLSRRLYLECWPREGSPRVDLIVGVEPHVRERLADLSLAPPDVRGLPGWQRVGAWARAWSKPGSRLEPHVKGAWLEFDLEPHSAPARALAEPRLFVDFHGEAAASPSGRARLSRATLEPLLGESLGPPTSERLDVCLERLPAGAVLGSLGVTFREGVPTVRLCVRGLGRGVVPYLDAVGWPGDLEALVRTVLAPLEGARAQDRAAEPVSVLHLDLSPDVTGPIGLECAFSRRDQAAGRIAETAVLERLVAQGWCPPASGEALLRWPGRTVELMDHEIWHSRVDRRLGHVKLRYAPDGVVELKAYLYLLLDLLPGGAMVGTRPRWFRGAGARANGLPTPSSGAPARFAPPPVMGIGPEPAARARTAPGGTAGIPLARGSVIRRLPMMMPYEHRQALERILARASVDQEYRHLLLTQPRLAILDMFELGIPSDFRVQFIEKGQDTDALVVLPDLRPADGELSDLDLQAVSGGHGSASDWW
jgi:hypothetical protein